MTYLCAWRNVDHSAIFAIFKLLYRILGCGGWDADVWIAVRLAARTHIRRERRSSLTRDDELVTLSLDDYIVFV